MAEGFTTTPESFPPSADQLRQAGQQLTSAWAPVHTQSLAVHFGSGDDVLSPLIQVSLQEAVELVDSSLTSCSDALDGYADGLEAMGSLYGEAEQDTRSMMSKGN